MLISTAYLLNMPNKTKPQLIKLAHYTRKYIVTNLRHRAPTRNCEACSDLDNFVSIPPGTAPPISADNPGCCSWPNSAELYPACYLEHEPEHFKELEEIGIPVQKVLRVLELNTLWKLLEIYEEE